MSLKISSFHSAFWCAVTQLLVRRILGRKRRNVWRLSFSIARAWSVLCAGHHNNRVRACDAHGCGAFNSKRWFFLIWSMLTPQNISHAARWQHHDIVADNTAFLISYCAELMCVASVVSGYVVEAGIWILSGWRTAPHHRQKLKKGALL